MTVLFLDSILPDLSRLRKSFKVKKNGLIDRCSECFTAITEDFRDTVRIRLKTNRLITV